MRKPKLANSALYQRYCVHSLSSSRLLTGLLLLSLSFIFLQKPLLSQCTVASGQLRATAFVDKEVDGIQQLDDDLLADALVQIYDAQGDLVTEAWTDALGTVLFDGLEDGTPYRVEWELPAHLSAGPSGANSGTLVQFVEVPACTQIAAVNPSEYCDVANPTIAVTCFVKGNEGENDQMETIVGMDYFFKNNSPMHKLASKGETGAVWGLAWKASTAELFSSAFVKQSALLGTGGAAGIYKTSRVNGQYNTALFADLSALAYPAGELLHQDHTHCDYGADVARKGLGGLALSADETTLYAVNIDRQSVIALPTVAPNFAQMREYPIPGPQCENGDFYIFALKYYRGKLYVGGTCDASGSKSSEDLSIHIFSVDPADGATEEIFTSTYPKGYWYNSPADGEATAHWLTDIEFTTAGNMVIALADRTAHRYCGNGQVLNQFPDILMLWQDAQGQWQLENNGVAGPLVGSGQNNGQGPGGGEFFGEDNWVIYPDYHSEVAMGTLYNLPGADEIVLTAFDPLYNTFAGGLHRYNTNNGSRVGAIEMYQTTNNPTFGKASGLGEIVALCGPAPIEIGNFVWFDANQNGVQDPGEEPVADLEISLFDEDCNEIARTTTDARGEYYFNASNVDTDLDGEPDALNFHEKYYIAIADARFDTDYGVLEYGSEFFKITSPGQGGGHNPDESDSDAIESQQPACPQLQARPFVTVYTGGSGQSNHSFDIGLQPADAPPVNQLFDLALRMTTGKTTPVKPGEKVAFFIDVFNQGVGSAAEVCIVNYLPTGLRFEEADNPGWALDGNMARYSYNHTLAEGDSFRLEIILEVKADATPDGLVNLAEICGALDERGRALGDVDSSPDSDPGNDTGGVFNDLTDNMIDDHGTIDEDDHDPAGLQLLDLNLSKSTAQLIPVKMGEDVLYTLQLTNEGNVSVKNISITDYLPAGMEISPNDISGWSQQGSDAVLTIQSELPPGESITIHILTRTNGRFDAANTINRAEITRLENRDGEDWSNWDFDSTPDNGEPGEDDIDNEQLPVFDLALRKSILDNRSYASGETAIFTIEIFNQGNLEASSFSLIDHLPAGMSLAPDDNNGWEPIDPFTARLDYRENLAPGFSTTVEMRVLIDDNAQDGELINVVEILEAATTAGLDPIDFDSEADDDPSNDAGGEVYTSTDNALNGRGIDDEDDHDPAVLRVSNVPEPVVDLALTKKSMARTLEPGEHIDFEIAVINQGELAVGSIEITDYMPPVCSLHDPAWSAVELPGFGSAARKTLSIANGMLPEEGLEPGDSIKTYIRLKVAIDTEPGRFLNFAEISMLRDIDGNNLVERDVDSSPDDNPENDFIDLPGSPMLSGNITVLAQYQREDDFDFDEFSINAVSRSLSCLCLDNATSPTNGQFLDEIEVYAVSGQTWHIELAEGFFDESSPAPPAAPTAFATGPAGTLLTEYPDTAGMSFYRLRGIHVDGQGYHLILRNEYDERLVVQGVNCNYPKTFIDGLDRVCRGSTTEFSVINPEAGVTYTWDLASGGTIIGAATGETVEIEWDQQNGGPHLLTVVPANTDTCAAPGEISIIIGQEARSVTCKSHVQISVGQDCIIDVTPQMILAGGPYDLDSYAVMLTDKGGAPIQNLTLGRDRLNEDITAKVINVCTGNSCWSTIRLEDKMPPQIECLDDTLRCNNLSEYTGPLVWDNCDPNPTIVILDERIEPLNCDELFVKRVIRQYQAFDDAGNESDICEQVILLRRINLNGIEFPDDRSIATANPLVCGSYPLDDKGNPDPEYTGVPYLEGLPMYPYPDYYCNAAVFYTDTELPSNGCVKKIMRVWSATEFWCSRAPRVSAVQILEITDNVAPDIECPRDMTVTVAAKKCEAEVNLPPAIVSDNCNEPVEVDIIFEGGLLENQNGGLATLPLGINEVVYRATDACYNSAECVMIVEVQDNTPPVAVCDQHTVVSLSVSGEVEVFAQTFDDGSYDGCWIDSMAVRRMESDSTCGLLQTSFAPWVRFCCADAGQIIPVEFRVWDEYGNWNACMVNVEIQDKIAPVIQDLPGDTISCHHIPTEAELDSIYGFPIVTDNCDYLFTSSTYYDIDQCMEGVIVRSFAVQDANNVSISTQEIVVINEDPFTADDIIWPLDTTIYNACSSADLHPDDLGPQHGYPLLTEDECDLTGFTFEDETYEFVNNNDACFKIVRTWKVINWCRDDAFGNPLVFEYDQTIKVHNTIAPVILSSCDSVSTCTYDVECLAGFIELVQQAEDDCTPDAELAWKYEIDLFGDGVVDTLVRGNGALADASGEYPIGTHSIKWVFEDRCGNASTCTQIFEIINCKAPTVYCKNGIIVELMPVDLDGDGELDNELVEIWAKDLDGGSSHPCGYPLTWSFGRDTTIKNRVYDCDSIGQRFVEICVTTPNGNQACCLTEVIVQDNNDEDICEDIDCVIPPPDTIITDCVLFNNPTPDRIGSFPDTSNCPRGFRLTITYRDRGLVPTPPECGKIERTWTIELDRGGRTVTREFIQIIIFQIDFEESDIAWPDLLIELDDCVGDIDPDALNSRPLLLENFCGLVRVDYNDVDISDPNDVCRIVRRRWTATNICDPTEVFDFIQTIVVYNYLPPIVTCPADVTVQSVPNACGANVSLLPAVTTDCSTGVIFENTFNQGGANASGFYPVGTTVVTFTATDHCGQSSSCETRITVEDNIPPNVICPDDVTVSCDFAYGALSEFGDPIIVDNCTVTVDPDSIFNLDACHIGTIIRTWVVSDPSGNVDSCAQTISFENLNPFTEQHITWPDASLEIFMCNADLDPDVLNSRPVIDTASTTCEDVTVSFSDIPDTLEACLVVQRTWTVENSCQPVGVYSFTQEITVYNAFPPVLTCPPDLTVSAEPDICGAEVVLEPVIFTDCSVGVIITNDHNNGGANASGFFPAGMTTVTFTATDSCGNVSTCQVDVTVLEDVPPVITCPADMTVDCDFSWTTLADFGEPSVQENCTFTLQADSLISLDACQAGTIVRTWIVTDGSGNADTCSQTITFNNPDPFTETDITWPEDTVVVNNCGAGLDPDIIDSRPMLDTLDAVCLSVNVDWDDVDISDTNDVCLVLERTWTIENECNPIAVYTFTQVIILLNAEAPLITCPADVTVSADPDLCGAVVSLTPAVVTDCSAGVVITNNYNNGGADASGFFPAGTTVVTFTAEDDCGQTSTCQVSVTVNEDVVPVINCPADVSVDCEFVWTVLSEFGEPDITENCMFTLEADSLIDLNVCQIGVITRSWVVTDLSGNADSCTQTITFDNPTPFNEIDHIVWPVSTINIDTCGASTHPDSLLSRPAIDTISSTCELVTVTWTDQSSSFCNASPCLQIERTWVVTDSCQLDLSQTPPAGQWTFVQIINVNDFDPPVITGVTDVTIVSDSTSCDRFVSLVASAMDCDPNVNITNNSPFAANMNSGDASGEYPIGITMVTFIAEDACCNIDSVTVTIEVIDSIPPVAFCQKSVKPMSDTLSVPFYPWDMVQTLFDNCTDSADLILSYDPVDPTDTVRHITCDSLDMLGEYLAPINIYITDEAGNQDTCVGFVNVVDPDSLCPRNLNAGVIYGRLGTPQGKELAEADVHLDGAAFAPNVTGNEGRYAFPLMPFGGNYVVRPHKDIDPLNGVTTKDIIRIQQHLLGDKPFNSPYELIAADVDKSNSVSVRDIVWLRKMLLGYQEGFPNGNTSWRFVDAAYQFPNPAEPFDPAFPEVYQIEPFTSNMEVDFVSVKIGDVSGDARTNNYAPLETRSSDPLILGVKSETLEAGTSAAISIFGENIAGYAGFQTLISWDPNRVDVTGIQPVHPSFTADNFSMLELGYGRLLISWHSPDALDNGTELFSLIARIGSVANTVELFDIEQQSFRSEAYDWTLNAGPVSLQAAYGTAEKDAVRLFQNQPNPFSDQTHIVFSLPATADVRLSIFDLSGKKLWEINDKFDAGLHAVPVKGEELNGGGMYIYRLETADFTASKRMFFAK